MTSLSTAATVSIVSTLIMRLFNAPARSLREDWDLALTAEPVAPKLAHCVAAAVRGGIAIADDLLLRALKRTNPPPLASPFATL